MRSHGDAACAQYFGADSVPKPHNPYGGGSLFKTASYDGIGRYSARLEASNLDRGLSNAGLYATPHRTPSVRCAFRPRPAAHALHE